MEKSTVALLRCGSYDEDAVFEAVSRGLSLLGGAGRFAKRGERILLKPNVLVGARPDDAVTTHPSVFLAVARALQNEGASLSYGDSPGFGRPGEAMVRCGLAAAAERLGIPLGDFESSRPVDFPGGTYGKRFDIAAACLDADGIVSLPKMKSHQLTRLTGALKNTFGCVQGLSKAAWHAKVPNQANFARMLADLNRAVRPRLFVMDGIVAMEGNGPRSGTPVKMDCILMSADPVALDAVFCRLVGFDPEWLPAIVRGAEVGLGRWRAEEIELAGDDFAALANPAFDVVRRPVGDDAGKRRIPAFLGDAVFPRPVIDSGACISCGVCVDACPVEGKALAFRPGRRSEAPRYRYSKCIRCYCCQELCPRKAISVETPWLGRLLAGGR